MDRKLNLTEKLDFNEIDLTAPDKVIEEIIAQLPEETNGVVLGEISSYNGPVMSYTMKGLSEMSLAFGTEHVDIQTKLGELGKETHKFECYLYTPVYDKYKYRVFFVKYGIANYPVNLIIEQSVADSISAFGNDCVLTCNTREELETLVVKILTSKRTVAVMQELIRISQAKKIVGGEEEIVDIEDDE